jgi:hypothetical protein
VASISPAYWIMYLRATDVLAHRKWRAMGKSTPQRLRNRIYCPVEAVQYFRCDDWKAWREKCFGPEVIHPLLKIVATPMQSIRIVCKQP